MLVNIYVKLLVNISLKKKEKGDTKKPMTVETIISVFKDEKVNLKL